MLNINMSIRESLGNLPSHYAQRGSIKKKKMTGHDNNGCCVALALIITRACNRISSLWINGLSFCHDLWGATPARSYTRGCDGFSQKDLMELNCNFRHLNRERMYTMKSSSQKVSQHCSLVTREQTHPTFLVRMRFWSLKNWSWGCLMDKPWFGGEVQMMLQITVQILV